MPEVPKVPKVVDTPKRHKQPNVVPNKSKEREQVKKKKVRFYLI